MPPVGENPVGDIFVHENDRKYDIITIIVQIGAKDYKRHKIEMVVE